jgi:hypothetical protein
MRKLYLHVGFAKCGSTSLQAALQTAPNIMFPKSGNHGGEHLAFALTIRGVDEWTRQYFDEKWAEQAMVGLLKEIEESTEPVVISSERLAAMSVTEIQTVAELFKDFDTQVIIVRRNIDKYLSSTWRHAVYRHDFGESYEDFLKRFHNFAFAQIDEKFKPYFQVHSLNMEDPDYLQVLEAMLGTTLVFPHSNEGVPFEFAAHLQKLHTLLGSTEFKKIFDKARKAKMLRVWKGEVVTEIEQMTAPLF